MIEKAYNIKIDEYTAKSEENEVLCLGFFDCVHQGHLKLINRAKQIAFMNDYFVSIFTFDNNPLKYFKDQKLLYTFDERCFVFEEMQIDHVYKATFTKDFASIDRETFSTYIPFHLAALSFSCSQILSGSFVWMIARNSSPPTL